jgi:hypothetical protein
MHRFNFVPLLLLAPFAKSIFDQLIEEKYDSKVFR